MMCSRSVCVVVYIVALMIHPGVSRAADNFELRWSEYSYRSLGGCGNSTIVREGATFFRVDSIPIPTFTLSGSPLQYANGDVKGEFDAPFSGALLRIGSNSFAMDFSVVGGSQCDISDHRISLQSQRGVNRQLFTLQVRGREFHGSTSVDLGLREIDPQLADDVARWKREFDESLRLLQTAGSEQSDYLSRLSRLEALSDDVDDLFKQGFGDVTPEELLQVLDAYDDILSPDAQAALVDLLSSFRQDIEEVRAELDRISTELTNQAQELNTKIENVSGNAGFDSSDLSNYIPLGNPGGIPIVILPAQSGTDPFDPAHDPYAAMATEVATAVQATLDGQGVRDRAAFLQLFASWRRNISTIEASFLDRAWISQKEYTAFLAARSQILNLFRNYVSDDGWLKDTPIPDDIKPLIDLLVVLRMEELANSLRISLNEWRGQLTDRQQMILNTVRALRAALEERKSDLAHQEDEQQSFWSGVVENTVIVVRSAVLALTPVGDFVDLCEVVTGREMCLPDGRVLSVKERMLSGAGLVAGSGHTWRAIAGVVRKSERVTKKLSDIYDELRILTPRKGIVKTELLTRGRKRYTHESGISAIFDKDGFPNFLEHAKRDLNPGQRSIVEIELSGSRRIDERLANAKAGFTEGTPDGWVWHHDKKLGTMLLIPESVHDAFPHTGGVAIWQKIMGQDYQ